MIIYHGYDQFRLLLSAVRSCPGDLKYLLVRLFFKDTVQFLRIKKHSPCA
jgi:hypothetical protein